jgi:hypothetical protein
VESLVGALVRVTRGEHPVLELSDAEREERVRTAIAKAPEYGMGFVTPPPDAEG